MSYSKAFYNQKTKNMIFGTTYCNVSHLPIEDGDYCYLIPLGFEIASHLTKWNKADINMFLYPYRFVHTAEKVKYGGNPDEIEYCNKKYKQVLHHQLYMLIHSEFWKQLQKHNDIDLLKTVERLPNFTTISPIWNDLVRHTTRANVATPENIKEIYWLAMFMDKMNIMPAPANSVDQHQTGKLYEEIKQKAKKKYEFRNTQRPTTRKQRNSPG